MTIIFKCKSNEAYCLKILAELLTNNIKTGCFEIDETGISLCMMDHHRRVLIDLKLYSENFSVYKFKSKKMYLGINLNHFHKMLKSIKKKDSIQLYIDDASPTDLAIRVIPKENNRITTSYVKIQSIQNLIIDGEHFRIDTLNPSSDDPILVTAHLNNLVRPLEMPADVSICSDHY